MTNGYPEQIGTLIQSILQHQLGNKAKLSHLRQISGGCINHAWLAILVDNSRWFIKTNQATQIDMFAAEYLGLQAIRATQTIYAPEPIAYGVWQDNSYLLLEYLNLHGPCNPQQAGQQLAHLHQHTSKQFGWQRDNTIGSTPQSNQWHKDWVSFWQKERLGKQLALANKQGYPSKAFEQGLLLLEQLPQFFVNYRPEASLLHGDLWSGNLGYMPKGKAVIYDPAVYYGDRETDIAMTELFGGFSTEFYKAYQQQYPLDKDYKIRKQLYNLYHILNHYNLFGGNYAQKAANMTHDLLASLH